ncbi:hypothetical protein D0Y65_012028 [Glycine soja]|uniref:Retrovirus-related Pol polyprotein from transposon TNT 1-94-like beta-barrel domain-containing protein n=1 Tax=Glycine soja TaxID=3848 RepID=A0A445KMB1_GLYSO|nr:hypothetical protein D0Y65_012028 [Glycine soja]
MPSRANLHLCSACLNVSNSTLGPHGLKKECAICRPVKKIGAKLLKLGDLGSSKKNGNLMSESLSPSMPYSSVLPSTRRYNKHAVLCGVSYRKRKFSATKRLKESDIVRDSAMVPEDAEMEVKDKMTMELAIRNENDYLCKNFILNGLANDLYDYYSPYKSAKLVWLALEKKYDTEEAETKKYVVSRYLKYQMSDDKSVKSQSHEIQKIAQESYIAVTTEINMIGESDGWWVDTGASCHVCYDRATFKTYTNVEKKEKVLLGDSHTTTIVGTGDVELKNSGGTSSSHLPAIGSENLAQPEPDIEPRRGKRTRIAKEYGPDYMTYTSEEDPSDLQEALSSLDADLWQEAINNEMDSLESNKT